MLDCVGLGFVVLGIEVLFHVLQFTVLIWVGLGFVVLGVGVLFHVKRLEHFQIHVIFLSSSCRYN